jgi:phosphatidylglycerophosphate synthase
VTGEPPVVVYLSAAADVQVAHLTVAGRPIVFRAIAGAVRAGASRVLVPASFRELVSPALASAPRVARAIEWLDAATPPPGFAVLVPATAVTEARAIAATLTLAPAAARDRARHAPDERAGQAATDDGGAPAIHEGSRAAGMPIVAAPASLVDTLWPSLAAGAPVGATLERALADPGLTYVRDLALVHAVRDAASAASGERRLYTTLGSAIDTRLDTVFHRRFSRRVSRLAVACGIRPNTISLASLLVGLLAAWAFWRASALDALVGFVLYAIAVIIDHADGEVARLTLTESAIGEWLDIAVDTVVHAAVVIALGVTSASVTGQGLGLGVLAAVGVIASAAVAKAWPGLAMPDRVGAAIVGLGEPRRVLRDAGGVHRGAGVVAGGAAVADDRGRGRHARLLGRARALSADPRALGRGHRVRDEPVFLERLDVLDEVAARHGLGDVAVGAGAVALLEVLRAVRGRQHDDRDRPQPLVPLHPAEHLAAVHLREMDVQEDQLGGRLGGLGAVAQEVQGLLAVLGPDHLGGGGVVAESLEGEHGVIRVVFDEQDCRGHALPSARPGAAFR